MKTIRSIKMILTLACMGMAVTATAAAPAAKAAAPAAKAAVTGVRADVIHEIDEVQKKLVDLANAIPADKYNWKPAEGVRSVGEVYAHIAAGNDMFAGLIAGKPRAGGDSEQDLGGKDAIVAEMSASFARLRQTIETMKDADLGKKVKFFGQDLSEQQLIIAAAGHLHEHLGQSIAYARMNGVVPPWSK